MRFRSLDLALALIITSTSSGADLISNGSWLETFNAGSLVAGAGSSFSPSIESYAGVTTLSVSNPLDSWRVRARLSNSQWNNQLSIWVRRASDGGGTGTISGGNEYIELSGTDVTLFSGTSDRSNISIQYKLVGLSSSVAPNSYSSSIIFTVVSP